MTEKIEWYREVLTLEPHSRLFLPLARMLAEQNRTDEALNYLKNGVERHPDFLEARLFYADLLYRTGNSEECTRQIELIEKPLSAYSAFWEAWGAKRLTSAQDESGWALTFLAALFSNKNISLQDVMKRGLQSLTESAESQLQKQPSRVQALADLPASEKGPSFKNTSVMSGDGQSVYDGKSESLGKPDVTEPGFVQDLSLSPQFSSVQASPPSLASAASASMPEAGLQPAYDSVAVDAEVRTRSMADVLAEQGDLQGALNIYNELKKNALSADAFMELQLRIDAIMSQMSQSDIPARNEQQISDTDGSENGKARLISMLETLAGRVEARVHG